MGENRLASTDADGADPRQERSQVACDDAVCSSIAGGAEHAGAIVQRCATQSCLGWRHQLRVDRAVMVVSLYLAVVIDLYSRAVFGWAMGDRLTEDLATQALTMALWRRKPHRGLLHHSDRASSALLGTISC